MSGIKEKGFNERLSAAAEARKVQLDKFRAKPGPERVLKNRWQPWGLTGATN